MKKLILALALTGNLNAIAQETSSNFSFGANVQSRYIWRGLQFGGTNPSIQPGIEYTTGKFTFGAWGAYSLGTNPVQEMDLYLTFEINNTLSLTVTDYYFPTEGDVNNYLTLGANTGHVYEASIAFTSTETFPIGLIIASNFAGASTGATYIEASYTKTSGAIEYTLFAGGVLGDNNGYYLTDGAGLINLGIDLSKEIQLTKSFSLPVNTALIINPDAENVFLTFGFSL
ncbi:MAG: hypothetical protein P8K77_02910 [Polaribacter sp.]|nr:hypothetical protein [Polaribacter sp.]